MIAPSKKVRIIIAVALLSVSSIISASLMWRATQNKQQAGTLVAAEVEATLRRETVADDSDKDGDGLAKWEESLWQTSDSDADSDKDGTPDGQEVREGRDPTNGAANDFIVQAGENGTDEYEPAYTDPNTLTSRVAQTVFANYAKFSSQGDFTEDDSTALAAQIAVEAAKEVEYGDKYSIESLTTVTRPSQDQIRSFANSLIETVFDGLKEIGTNPAAYEDLSISANSYANTAKRLLAVPVPLEIAPIYVEIVNNLDGVGYALTLINDYRNDPARALLALRNYASVSEAHAQLFVQIQSYLQANGILFEESEPAALGFPDLVRQPAPAASQ